jgi:energy-coupling factor transporter transmembrane protein EcfT
VIAPAPVRGGAAWLLLGAMAGSLVAARFETAVACLLAAVLAGAAAGAPRPSGRWLWIVASGAALAWALNLFLIQGHPLAVPGSAAWPLPLHPTREGLALGGLVALRLAGAAAALHGLRTAWPGERAADQIARLFRPLEPLGVPVTASRAMVGLALRFAPLLADEGRRIARLQDLRAGRAPRGMSEWLERRRAATVPTLVNSLERAEQVALALEARHYRLRPVAAAAGGQTGTWGWAAAGGTLAGVALLWRR